MMGCIRVKDIVSCAPGLRQSKPGLLYLGMENEHDDDETYSNTTQSWEKATALELAASLAYSERRSDYAIYSAVEHPNITIIDTTKVENTF